MLLKMERVLGYLEREVVHTPIKMQGDKCNVCGGVVVTWNKNGVNYVQCVNCGELDSDEEVV